MSAAENPRRRWFIGDGRIKNIVKIGASRKEMLLYSEVISYNKKNFERELQNGGRQHNRQQNKTKRREEDISLLDISADCLS